MVLRIEYIQLLIITIMLFVIMQINPQNVSAIHSNSQKEVSFKALTFLEINSTGVLNKLSATEAIKYKTHFDFVNLSALYNGSKIDTPKATYFEKENRIVVKENLKVATKDNYALTTNNIEYDTKTKQASTKSKFTLESNGSFIKGDGIIYDMKSKSIESDNIHAQIQF
ncbi:MAG: hypothetical protein KN64_03555 [Sulfurovum sp. AS07-7]|jgi:LPS export ABC transporter protein LptC|nr:MAG: hypothetical protein KN64_03555 [Sulfurovum sp. AS07-7]